MENHRIKVLLVDDDVLLGNAISRELNERGYDITFLNSIYGVDEAIQRLDRKSVV